MQGNVGDNCRWVVVHYHEETNARWQGEDVWVRWTQSAVVGGVDGTEDRAGQDRPK